jgi:antitoxin VapB
MTIAKTRTFRSGNSQAVRLPKDIAFGDEVELIAIKSGNVLTLYPVQTTIAEMIAKLATLPAPPSIEARETEEIPERPRL